MAGVAAGGRQAVGAPVAAPSLPPVLPCSEKRAEIQGARRPEKLRESGVDAGRDPNHYCIGTLLRCFPAGSNGYRANRQRGPIR